MEEKIEISTPEIILKNISNITANQTIQLAYKLFSECKVNDPNIKEIFEKVQYLSTINLDSLNFINDLKNDDDPLKFIDNVELNKILLEKKEGDILLYIEDISKYILFNNFADYKGFIQSIADDKGIKTCYQIVLTNEKQKAVLSYSNNSENIEKDLEELSNLIRKHLKSESKITYSELHQKHQIILTDCIAENYYNNYKFYHDLKSHISNKPEIVNNLGVFDPQHNDNIVKYIYEIITQSNGKSSRHDIDYYTNLVSIPNKNQNYPPMIFITNNINNSFNGNNNTNIISKKEDKNSLATKWIKNNPPNDKEFTQEYYDKYLAEIKVNCLGINKFSIIIKNLGYENIKNGKRHIWIKK